MSTCQLVLLTTFFDLLGWFISKQSHAVGKVDAYDVKYLVCQYGKMIEICPGLPNSMYDGHTYASHDKLGKPLLRNIMLSLQKRWQAARSGFEPATSAFFCEARPVRRSTSFDARTTKREV